MGKRRRRTPEFTYQEAGWPLQSNESGYPGLKLCYKMLGQRGKPVCDAIALWRMVKYRPGLMLTGYYCTEHLPTD